jgi:hypothetical protein
MLLIAAVRLFAGRPVRVLRGAIGVAVAAIPATLFLHGTASYAGRLAYLSLFLGFWDLTIAREGVRLARQQNLTTAWILVGLFAPTTILCVMRALLAVTGRLDSGAGLFSPGDNPHVWPAISMAYHFCSEISCSLVLPAYYAPVVEQGSRVANRTQRRVGRRALHRHIWNRRDPDCPQATRNAACR